MNRLPSIVEFVEDFVSPQSDNAVRARIAALEIENARMRAAQRTKEANAQAIQEKLATASAEQLMRQLLGDRKNIKN